MTDAGCTCGVSASLAGGVPLKHSITCMSAATQPHAMVDDGGDMYYPDKPVDATYFAVNYGAKPLDLDAFNRWLSEPDPLGHGFSDHGHPCCGRAYAFDRHSLVARCGGAPMCKTCTEDLSRRHGEADGGH